MKILIAVDGSPFTKRMLAYLTAHDEFPGRGHDYTVLTAVPPVPPRAAAVVDKATLDGYYGDEAEKVFKPIRSFLSRQGIDAKFQYKVGHAGETISSIADKGKFDLLVMGSHGHGTLTNLVMGSVATKVLAHSKVPVLLVR
ncbi:MAG TPA: universal stress protein [Rubrivivax sp.]|jgi:nucleotide-binding universal stress UspA family protein|nr:universal stress protein [Rhodoferax sp.]MCP5289237.1 universal stress protein [Burkholderiaceae bacterium]HMR68675.1 universal stress protein [Rubrivivax sp.]